MRFALVIPALNEEAAIGATLERALAAREGVVANTPIDEMLVVFVNDGSTDGTQAIADRCPEAIKIRFEKNKGYGAAIKEGFVATDAEIVGFMDADGTCDPWFCVELINHLCKTGADVVLGSRMSGDNEMPTLRRFGNWIFARLIGAVSGRPVTDAASGMRVIRRESLRHMVPLPDGLHFTPAMSSIAMLDPQLRIEEITMPYKERMGRSKLHVIKDGLRFLAIILFTTSLFNPIKALASLGFLFCAFGAILCWGAWLLGANATIIALLAASFILVFLQSAFVGLLCHQLNYMLIEPLTIRGSAERMLQKLFWTKNMVLAAIAIFFAGIVLYAGSFVLPAYRSYLWNLTGVCILVSGWLALGGVVLRVIWAAKKRKQAEREDPFQSQTKQ